MTTPFAICHVVAVKSGGKNLFLRGIREKVARDLLDGKLVKGQIAIESIDNPIPPRPVGAVGILLVTIGIGIACGIEPPHRHPLAMMG